MKTPLALWYAATYYSHMTTRREHAARPNRESLSKRLGKVARQIRERDGHACVYCGATAATSGSHLHLDHLTPKSADGQDVATNLVLACIHCNSARQNRVFTAEGTLPELAAQLTEAGYDGPHIRVTDDVGFTKGWVGGEGYWRAA